MRLILAGATIALAFRSAVSAQAPLTLVGTIALPGVEGRIDHLAVDAVSQRLYVAALGNNTVEILDVKNNRHLKSVPGFREPQGIAVVAEARAGTRVFVNVPDANQIAVVDRATMKVMAT